MADYAATVTFDSPDGAYRGYSELKDKHKDLGVRGIALVQRTGAGKLELKESAEPASLDKLVGTSFVDVLTKILNDDDYSSLPVVTEFAQSIPDSGNAVLLQTDEKSPTALDAFVSTISGTITREPLGDVVQVIEDNYKKGLKDKEAAERAEWEAKKKDWKEDMDARVQSLKDAFSSKKSDDKK